MIMMMVVMIMMMVIMMMMMVMGKRMMIIVVHCRCNNDVPVMPDPDVPTSSAPGPTPCPGLLFVSLFAKTFSTIIFEKQMITFQSALSATTAVTERRIMEKLKGSQKRPFAMVSSLTTFERLQICLTNH